MPFLDTLVKPEAENSLSMVKPEAENSLSIREW